MITAMACSRDKSIGVGNMKNRDLWMVAAEPHGSGAYASGPFV
jgi:hypothetical protein